MDFYTAHNIIHAEAGNDSARCGICNGTIDKEDAHAEADKIVANRMSHNMPMPSAYSMDDKDKAKKNKVDGLSKISKSKSFVIDLARYMGSDATLPQVIQVMPLGEFDTQKYGKLKIARDDIDEMALNFNKQIKPGTPLRAGVPIDVDHDGGKAAGWIRSLKVMSDGLWADVEWTPYGETLLKNKEYRFLSPEFDPEYTDPEHSDIEAGNVLIAASLVNRPLFKELRPLVASEGHLTKDKSRVMMFTDMDLDQLKQRRPETLSAEEKAYLEENMASLSADEQVALGLTTPPTKEETPVEETPVVETPVETPAEETPAVETPAVETPVETPAVEGKESRVTLTASEVTTLRKAAEELRVKKLEEAVAPWLFSEKGGKVLPKSKDKIVNFMRSLSESQTKTFSEIMSELPDKGVAMFSEVGSSNNLTKGGTADTLNAVAKKLVEDGKAKNFGEGIKQAIKENPELANYGDDLTPVESKIK